MDFNITFLAKDGDHMTVATEHLDPEVFLSDASRILSQLIEKGQFDSDWEFQLDYWLRQISEVYQKLKKRPSDAEVIEEVVVTDKGFITRRWTYYGAWPPAKWRHGICDQ